VSGDVRIKNQSRILGFIANLSKGKIGKDTSRLLGSMLNKGGREKEAILPLCR